MVSSGDNVGIKSLVGKEGKTHQDEIYPLLLPEL